MRLKVIRILGGVILVISGVVVLVRGNLEWWNGVLPILVGVLFLYSAFKVNKKQ
ncbi:hypothetical protein [Paenibacillus sp. FSL H7-0326]|uniref:hypothetical protein n=1 Tax=Paenibacillus sp. FSL H7-0326 TaxID=1921144 RepID=UPI0015C3D63B|nr:hypothetical protein [Paenibacillus sp. FSL H7-0326]